MLQYNDEISERLGLTNSDLLDLLNPDFDCGLLSKLDSRLNSRYDSKIDSNNNGSCRTASGSVSGSNVTDLACSSKKNGDKYSLRPRSARRKKGFLDDSDEQDQNYNELSGTVGKRNQNKPPRGRSTTQNRPKQKSAPLSKYRRKTANARERSRMREINMAFEALRRVVPQITPSQQQNEKLTKITTLRLAMKYISTLSASLNNCPTPELPQQDLFSECSELESFLLESDGESLPLRSDQSDRSLSEDHSITPSAEFSLDFDDSLTPDFGRLTPDFADQLPFDPFLGDFS